MEVGCEETPAVVTITQGDRYMDNEGNRYISSNKNTTAERGGVD